MSVSAVRGAAMGVRVKRTVRRCAVAARRTSASELGGWAENDAGRWTVKPGRFRWRVDKRLALVLDFFFES